MKWVWMWEVLFAIAIVSVILMIMGNINKPDCFMIIPKFLFAGRC